MSENTVKWHPFPQEEMPENGRYFVTIRGLYGKFVKILRNSPDKKWMHKYVIAWAELPNKYDKRTKKDAMFNWHPYPDEIPYNSGYCLITLIYKRKRYIDMGSWYPERRIFDREEKIIAWAEMPDPYEEESNNG